LHRFLSQCQGTYLSRDWRSVMFGQLIGKRDRSVLNANHSPFLYKLPPEVRIQIYEYALGGNTIFFRPHKSTCTAHCHPNRYRCRAHVAKEPTEASSQPSDHEQVKESQHRPKSDWESAGDVSLELLLTCRQIYNEAVLIPFSHNDFGLNSNQFAPDERTRILFLRDLIPDQSRAISTLHIQSAVRHGLVLQDNKKLSGLRRLQLSFDWNIMWETRGSPQFLMTALEDRFDASGVSMFAMGNFQTVEIAIDLTVHLQHVQAVMAQKDELVAWVESKRALLLTKPTPVARTSRAASEATQSLRFSARIRAQREKEKTSDE